MAGRHPKPYGLRVLEGGKGKHRPLTPDLQAPAEQLVAPKHLSADQVAAWTEHVAWCRKLGTESAVDAGSFEAMIVALCEARQCQAVIAEKGRTTYGAKGGLVSRPEVAIAANCWDRYNKFAVQFGLTPTARVKLNATTEEPEGASDVPAELRDVSS